ncbi:hypothetical protein J3R30DRAFT_3341858 [Lentinula aciculospora]|uniref:Zn(2)-C6 fungal-type domain-containing protein n=1 Tax=Lentinula aciculospora TaxID=153920 RepID=A0A9W9A0P9_9AGAR|nr:hypothetical protein J3R30DRAFT_3341858 [Lentinula aciculospora]
MVDVASTKKCKKLAACDYCKMKRVICHPQQNGSCPRCLKKGVICKTSPVVRRKRKSKAQLEQERALSTSGNSPSTEAPSLLHKTDRPSNSLERWRETSLRSSSPSIFFNLAPPSLSLPPSLVRELFQDLRVLPQFYYPLLPLNDLQRSLNICSWNVHALAPRDRVLAQCIIAVSARISKNSLLVDFDGHGLPDISTCAPFKTRYLDFRECGRRRENICEQLKEEAARLAQREGVMYNPCISNAVSLALLEFLEYRASGNGANVYSAAYIHHLRELSEDASNSGRLEGITPIAYSGLLMGLAVCAVTTRKSLPFTHNDELLLCGEDRTSLEQIINLLSPDSVVATPIYAVMRPMCFQTIHLARDISETLTGAFARRHPLNENKLTYHLDTLDLLHSAIASGVGQMHRLRNIVDEEKYQNMRFCAYPLIHAWGALILIVYDELKRRRELTRLTEVDLMMGSVPSTRFGSLYLQVKSMASQAALEVAEALEEVPTLSRLTHMNYCDLTEWATFLLDDADANDLSVSQRVWALGRFRDGLSLAGFSWVDRSGTVEAIDGYLASCAIQEITNVTSSMIWPFEFASTENHGFISDWQIQTLPLPGLS